MFGIAISNVSALVGDGLCDAAGHGIRLAGGTADHAAGVGIAFDMDAMGVPSGNRSVKFMAVRGSEAQSCGCNLCHLAGLHRRFPEKNTTQTMKTRRYRTGALLGGLILSLGSLGLQAQEANPAPPPPKERPAPAAGAQEGVRAERIRQRVRDLHAAGKHEEANRLVERMRQAHMTRERAQRPMAPGTPRGQADGAAGKKSDRMEDRRAQAGRPERKGPPQPMGPPPVMKVRNLRMAAGLLEAAGYRDQAGKARQEAGRIEGEMREMEEMKKRGEEKRRAEEGKRRELEKRKAEETKDRPDPAAGMREEMQKLRREVEELRGQLKKARAEAEARPDRGRREPNRPR
jgi:hypothetical protein